MRSLNLRKEHIITKENVLPMSGIIASTALKAMLAYDYSERLLHMYYDLIHDLKCNEMDGPFSDGYDLVMTAACYLCEHIGESLNDMTGEMVMGKKVTVLKACYSRELLFGGFTVCGDYEAIMRYGKHCMGIAAFYTKTIHEIYNTR